MAPPAKAPSPSNTIVIRGAREHNLDDVSLDLPRDRLIVFTGLSGSGKSSLAFDTIYAEGQRRYVESLSAYARQFLGQMDKPDVDVIEGLSPAISIDQKSASRNPRSTVGTVTEIYDYLRLLFARVGVPHDPETGERLVRQTPQQIVDRILQLPEGTRFQVIAPMVRGRKGTYEQLFADVAQRGFTRVRVDGEVHELPADIELARYEQHTIEVIIDRLVLRDGIERRLTDSMETALELAEGMAQIEIVPRRGDDGADAPADAEPELLTFSEKLARPSDGKSFEELAPRNFSFNSPYGACPRCDGLGTRFEVDPELVVPNPALSVDEGALSPWARGHNQYFTRLVESVAAEHAIPTDVPYADLNDAQRDLLLADAITLRSDLEKRAALEAQATGEYLRPIMLIQAERVDECEALRERMVSEYGIEKDTIKISTGKLDELSSISDVGSQKCPVRFIITVQKLREGWDCPFAYVLCSLKETRSATAIEQIVGRILRLPQAQRKQQPDLNCSYAFSVSSSISEVLAELRDALESNGFTPAEAERIIVPVSQGIMPLGAQPKTLNFGPEELIPAAIETTIPALDGKVRYDAASGSLTIFVPLAREETEKLQACVSTPDAKQKIAIAVKTVCETERAFGGSGESRLPSPYEQQLDFFVPLLCVQEGTRYFEFESTFLLEQPWKLSGKDASLAPDYNPLKRPAVRSGILDVGDKGEVRVTAVRESPNEDFVAVLHQQLLQLGMSGEWTQETLSAWLDRQIDHQDIPFGESAEFLRKVLRGLTAKYEIEDVSMLALDRFRLRDQIEVRIQQHRNSERKKAFQTFLLPESALAVTETAGINFKTMYYEPSQIYSGSFVFNKHYFGPRPGELTEKNANGKLTEEFKCAQFLDGLPEVKFWVRNLARKKTSFRLQTSTDWFYPDFICQLTDGRVLVVEYKGGYLYTAQDAEEKRAVGTVWASRSSGKCLFVMPEGDDLMMIANSIHQ